MTRALAFFPRFPLPLDYGSRLARLRWRRAAGARRIADWDGRESAREALTGGDLWIVVRDPTALPVGAVPEPPDGRITLARPAPRAVLSGVHTLRELERARLVPGTEILPAATAPAFVFRATDFPARDAETLSGLIGRLQGSPDAHAVDAGFSAVVFDDPSERERPELTRCLPDGALRILDVGCGAGAGIAGAGNPHPEWTVTGIEKAPRLASLARSRCDRVIEGDLTEVLPRLAARGELFEAIVFADVLEHLDDPITALGQARLLAEPEGVLLVSVPNVGHLSLARDLLCGRFDPVPAGLADAGHLRWFTRSFLGEALGEAGWRLSAIDAVRGDPPSEPEAFAALVADWPEVNTESLSTYQWIAQGVNRAS